MEHLTESVRAAEQKAFSVRAKSRRLRARTLHLNSERLDMLLRVVYSAEADPGYARNQGHAYLLLNQISGKVERVLYLYECRGIYVVPIGNVTYLCDTLVEGEARLYDWAEESGIFRKAPSAEMQSAHSA